MNIYVQIFLENLFSVLLSIYLGVELLGHMAKPFTFVTDPESVSTSHRFYHLNPGPSSPAWTPNWPPYFHLCTSHTLSAQQPDRPFNMERATLCPCSEYPRDTPPLLLMKKPTSSRWPVRPLICFLSDLVFSPSPSPAQPQPLCHFSITPGAHSPLHWQAPVPGTHVPESIFWFSHLSRVLLGCCLSSMDNPNHHVSNLPASRSCPSNPKSLYLAHPLSPP